jgi:hypothetical protein
MPACADCSGTASLTGTLDFSQGQFDDIYDEIFSLPDISLAASTYWLELQNDVNTNGTDGYWVMNGGPSSIWQSDFGDQTGSNCAVADPVSARTPLRSMAPQARHRSRVRSPIRQRNDIGGDGDSSLQDNSLTNLPR